MSDDPERGARGIRFLIDFVMEPAYFWAAVITLLIWIPIFLS
jgi:hypothetical protein